MINGIARFNI